MTQTEIKQRARLTPSSLNFSLYSSAFRTVMTQEIYVPTLDFKTGETEQDLDKLLTPRVVSCINDFLNLERADFIDRLQDDIFRAFNYSIEASSYGMVPDELIEQYGNTEANRRYFGGRTKEEVFANCRWTTAYYDPDEDMGNSFQVLGEIEWDQEHGITLSFTDGRYREIDN